MTPISKSIRISLEETVILFTILVFIILGVMLYSEHDALISILKEHGLVGLFIVSFLGSTIFIFFPIEGVFPFLLASGVDTISMILVATLGSLMGTSVNYALGFIGSNIIEKKVDHEKIRHAKEIMNKYGWVGLFIIVALPFNPIAMDPVTVIPGLTKMNYIEFAVTVTAAKILKYGFYAAIILGLINGFHL